MLRIYDVVLDVLRRLRPVVAAIAAHDADLARQLRRAATSVTANIAEGLGRFGYQENIQFCRQARGSIFELRDHLTTCVDQGYLELTEAKRLDSMAQRVAQILNGYLRSTLKLKMQKES